MANINNVKIGSGNSNKILFNNYHTNIANKKLLFKTIIPKDNNKISNSVFGEWQINDGWEVEILDDKRIAIKKFRIDTWGLRKIFNQGNNNDTDPFSLNDALNLKVKVTGIDYIHKNVVYQEDSQGNKTYGFVKAYAGTGGYNVYWYPGQFTSGNSIQGLGIQASVGYTANNNEKDDSFQMGKHPWDIGNKECITDGQCVGTWFDGSYKAISIGLYGGYQNAASWHDYSGDAYKVYDISEHPIIIDLNVPDTTIPIDVTSIECWDSYVGSSHVYHKDKTIDNCWKSYNLIMPHGWTLHRNNLGTADGLTWISPFKFKVSKVYTSGVSIFRQISNRATYWGVSFKAFKVKVFNKPDDVTVKIERLFSNVNTSENTSIELSNGTTEILAYSKTLYASNSSVDMTATEAKITISSSSNQNSNFTVEIIPIFDNDNLVVNTSIWSNILPKLFIPTVEDLTDEVMSKTKWQMVANNTELWSRIKNWYKNNIGVNDNFLGGNIFNGSDLDEITINMPNSSFLYGEDNFANSSIKTINFVQTNKNSHFSSPQRLLRSARNVSTINIDWAEEPNYICGATSIVDGMSNLYMETYPERFINWGANRTHVLSETYPCTLFHYAFNWSNKLVNIPSYPGTEDENTIITHRGPERAFYSCSSLVTVGPILDLRLAIPSSSNDIFHDCNKLEQLRIKNLNHGNWNFDGVSRNGVYHGTLKSLNSESVAYLFNNLADLTTSDSSKHEDTIDKSFKSWSSNYKNSADSSPDWDYTLTTITRFSCRKRYASIEDASFIAYTNQALSNMNVKVEGLEDGDIVVFLDENGNNSTEWTTNGSKSITKDSGIIKGFKLISSDINNRNTVTITIENGLDYTNPRVSSASIYCPVEWEDKITNAMISAANVKGWNIYIDGVEVQSN